MANYKETLSIVCTKAIRNAPLSAEETMFSVAENTVFCLKIHTLFTEKDSNFSPIR